MCVGGMWGGGAEGVFFNLVLSFMWVPDIKLRLCGERSYPLSPPQDPLWPSHFQGSCFLLFRNLQADWGNAAPGLPTDKCVFG